MHSVLCLSLASVNGPDKAKDCCGWQQSIRVLRLSLRIESDQLRRLDQAQTTTPNGLIIILTTTSKKPMNDNSLLDDDLMGEPDVLGEHVANLHKVISQIQSPGVRR